MLYRVPRTSTAADAISVASRYVAAVRLKIPSWVGGSALKHHGALIDKPTFFPRVVFHGTCATDADDGHGHGSKRIEDHGFNVTSGCIDNILKWGQHEDGSP